LGQFNSSLLLSLELFKTWSAPMLSAGGISLWFSTSTELADPMESGLTAAVVIFYVVLFVGLDMCMCNVAPVPRDLLYIAEQRTQESILSTLMESRM